MIYSSRYFFRGFYSVPSVSYRFKSTEMVDFNCFVTMLIILFSMSKSCCPSKDAVLFISISDFDFLVYYIIN